MENNHQNELPEEEISNPEQFQVGRVPSDEDQQTQDNLSDEDDVELGFEDEAPEGADDADADFESSEDDPV